MLYLFFAHCFRKIAYYCEVLYDLVTDTDFVAGQHRVRFLLTVFSVFLLSGSILADVNPFHLLLPGFFPIPDANNQVEEIDFYTLSHQNKSLISYPKHFLRSNDWSVQVKRTAASISRLPSLREKKQHVRYDAVSFPLLGTSIRFAWFSEKNALLIIYLSREALQDEVDIFLKKIHTDKKVFYLDGFFRVLTANIFKLNPEVQRVQYAIEEKSKKFDFMTFPLNQEHARTSF